MKDETARHAVPWLAGYHTLLMIDRGPWNRVVSAAFEGTGPFEGHGVAVVMSRV
jgi:hypothetical protein